jgi:uncharacterized membrane protein YgcG
LRYPFICCYIHTPLLFNFFALFLLSLFVTDRLMAASEEFYIYQERERPAGNPFPKRGRIKQRIMKDVVVYLKRFASATSRRGSRDSDGGEGGDGSGHGDGGGGGGSVDGGGGEEGPGLSSASSSERLTGVIFSG